MKFKWPILLLFNLFSTITLGQKLDWYKYFGSSNFEFGKSVVTDNLGNVYACGNYYGTNLQSQGINFINNNFTNSSADFFIIKYDTFGNIVWSKSFGGWADDLIYDIAVDSKQNIYATGVFKSETITIDGHTINNNRFDSFFLLKLDSSGQTVWLQSGNAATYGRTFAITIDNLDNPLITGCFYGPHLTFNSTEINISGSGYDAFVLKLNENGNVVWGKSFGEYEDEMGYVLDTDSSRNVYLTGSFFADSISYDGLTAKNSSDSKEFFILKLDENGNGVWLKSGGGLGWDEVSSISVNDGGDVFLCGSFNSEIIIFGKDTLANKGEADVFLAKFSANGENLWAVSGGGNKMDVLTDLCADKYGNVITTGYFTSDFFALDTNNLQNKKPEFGDMINIIYSCDGKLQYINSSGNINDDYGLGLCLLENGDAFVIGSFGGLFPINNSFLPDYNFSNFLLIKYNYKTSNCIPYQEIESTVINDFNNIGNGNFNLNIGDEINHIALYDVSGRMILNYSPRTNSYSFSIETNGIYILRYQTPHQTKTIKILCIN
jgi:hypothetical protein